SASPTGHRDDRIGPRLRWHVTIVSATNQRRLSGGTDANARDRFHIGRQPLDDRARCAQLANSWCAATRGARLAFVLARASGPRPRGWLCPVGEALVAGISADIGAPTHQEQRRR